MNIRCSVCNGIGLEKREPEKCPCPYIFCYKCENNIYISFIEDVLVIYINLFIC